MATERSTNLLLALLFCVCGVSSFVYAESTENSSEETAQIHPTDEHIKRQQHEEGLDDLSVDELVPDDAKRGPAERVVQPEKPLSLEERVDALLKAQSEKNEKLSDDEYLLRYGNMGALSIEREKSVSEKLQNASDSFINKYMRNKSVERIMLVSYILYRQVTTLALQRHYERREKDTRTFTEKALAFTPVGGTLFQSVDFFIRFGFSGLQFYVEMANLLRYLKDLKENPYKYAHSLENPHFLDGIMQQAVSTFQRAWYFFSDPTFYGSSLGLTGKTVVALALPGIWGAYLSKHATGNPVDSTQFRSASRLAWQTIVQSYAFRAESYVANKIPYDTQEKLFDYSAGILKPRLVQDVICDIGNYVQEKHFPVIKGMPVRSLKKRMGDRIVYTVLMQAVVGTLGYFVRNGAIQKSYGVLHKIGSVFSKLGLLKKNPVQSIYDVACDFFITQGFLEKGKPLSHVFDAMLMRILFAGAFSKAVRRVVKKSDLPAVTRRYGDFVGALSTIDGLTLYETIPLMALKPLEMPKIIQSLESIRSALTPVQEEKVMSQFVNEVLTELFFDRNHKVCQFITENIINFFIGSRIKSVQNFVLPGTRG